MPNEKGIWTPEEAQTGHLFSYRLAQFIAGIIPSLSHNILDFGCGPGAYLRYLTDIGHSACVGIEGTDMKEDFEYVDIFVHDLTIEFDITKRGHVICLEVAEHIPEQYTDKLIKNIVKHVKKNHFLIMSWAVPGQGGLGHVNCQSNEWVIERMYKEGFIHEPQLSSNARSVVESHLAYFKNTILIFRRND